MKRNTELTINVRPIRHAYFIDKDDINQFITVASFCCTQWGGINNLIIPVKIVKEGDRHIGIKVHGWVLSMLERRHPDIFINALSSQGDQLLSQALQTYLASESFTQPLEEWHTFLDTDDALHPLNIVSTQPESVKPNLAIPGFLRASSTPKNPFEEALLVAAFGRIWPDKNNDQEKEYEEVYTLQGWDASHPELLLRQQLATYPTASVINLTLKELSNIATENVVFEAPYMNIVVAETVWDLCIFWNLRACAFGFHWLTNRQVLLLSKAQLFHEQKAYIDPLISLLRERRVHRKVHTNLDVIFYHAWSEEISQFLASQEEFLQQDADSLQVAISFPPRPAEEDNQDMSETGKTHRPILYMEHKVVDGSVYHEYGGNRPIFSLPSPDDAVTLLIPPSGPRTRYPGKAYIGLQSEIWEQFPAHPAVAQLIVPNSTFDVFLNTIQLRYKDYFPPQGLNRISFALPRTEEIYQAYFDAHGYHTSSSEKEAYAKGLLGMAGGLSNKNASIFRSPIAYEILDVLTERPTQKLAQELLRKLGANSDIQAENLLQVIQDSNLVPSFRRNPLYFNEIYSRIKGKLQSGANGKKECLETLSGLIKIKAVQRGMFIKCIHCGTKIWYSLHMLDERMRCAGCLEMFDLPLLKNTNDDIDRPFQYALNPLVNQAMDQDILPVIIALLTLKTQHQEMQHVRLGMNFWQREQESTQGDFDFSYIYKHHLYGGECKAGQKLMEKDIRTARIAQALGFRGFFFITLSTFDKEGKDLVQNYQQELNTSQDAEHPFVVSILEKSVLFGMEPLPQQI